LPKDYQVIGFSRFNILLIEGTKNMLNSMSNMANTETQPYRIIKTKKDFEIRLYYPATMATITMNAKTYKELSSAGFRKIGFVYFRRE